MSENDELAVCDACKRLRLSHEVEQVTVTVVKAGEELQQGTLMRACADTPTCAERVRHRLASSDTRRAK